MRTEIGFDKKTVVADIGSGTGLLSKLFLENGNTGGVTWRGNISCRLRSEQGNRAATSAEYDRRRTPDERPPGYTRSVGDRGLGIGVDDDLGHMTRRIDVLGREH